MWDRGREKRKIKYKEINFPKFTISLNERMCILISYYFDDSNVYDAAAAVAADVCWEGETGG